MPVSTQEKKITVVICTFNRAKYLEKCLLSLCYQTLDKSFFKVLVVDNNPQNSSINTVNQFFNKLNIEYFLENNIGLSRARNRGLAETKTEYICFIDDDAEAERVWLEKILYAFSNSEPKIVAVSGRITLKYTNRKPSWITKNMESFLGLFDISNVEISNSGDFRGGNMALRRNFLESINGFSANLGRKGDRLLSNDEYYILNKIKEKNLFIYYHPEIHIKHTVLSERLNKTWFYKRYFWQGVSDSILSDCNYSKNKFKRFLKLILKSGVFIKFILPTSKAKQVEKKGVLFWELGKLYNDFGFYKLIIIK